MFYRTILSAFVFISFNCGLSYAETTLSFVGDVMMGSDYPDKTRIAPNKGATIFDDVKEIFLNSDIAFLNLEGAIADNNTSARKKSNGKTYSFRMPPYSAQRLAEAGFNVAAVANNHSRDFGEKGFKQTLNHLTTAGITAVGDKKGTPVYLQTGDKTIGLLAFYYFSAYHDGIQNINAAKELITDAKKNCDFLIVSFHGGAEGHKYYSVPKKTEMFHGENRGDVYKFARAAADAGADAVIGHAPHVIRAMEIYNGTFIAYSLGNFVGYGGFNISGNAGISAILQMTLSDDMKIKSVKVVPIKLVGGGIPIIDENKTALQKLNSYASDDFPETGVQFDENGEATLPSPEEQNLME